LPVVLPVTDDWKAFSIISSLLSSSSLFCRGSLAKDGRTVTADGDQTEHRRVRGNGQRFDEVERPDEEGERHEEEDAARVDDQGPPPPDALDELLLEQRHGQHADARAAGREAVGQGSTLLEVKARSHDGADEHDAHAKTFVIG
jgi:hypothetical protein